MIKDIWYWIIGNLFDSSVDKSELIFWFIIIALYAIIGTLISI